MRLPSKPLLWLNAALLAVVLFHSVARDVRAERRFCGDLRNRIVGARLQHDGRLPYWYRWSAVDGTRYYNPNDPPYPDPWPNRITGSPFLHTLLWPLAELPERQISLLWLGLEYAALAVTIGLMASLAATAGARWLIVNAGVLYTCTATWEAHIAMGQYYLFIALLTAVLLFLLCRGSGYTHVLAGFTAAVLVLVRPSAAVFILPFLVHPRRYRSFLAGFGVTMAVYGLFVVAQPFQRSLYRQYRRSLAAHTLLHQGMWSDSSIKKLSPLPGFPTISPLEGCDLTGARSSSPEAAFPIPDESGNVFLLFYLAFHRLLPVWLLEAIALFSAIGLTAVYGMRNFRRPPDPFRTIALAGALCMIVEMLSPIHRHGYNGAQFLTLGLLGLVWAANPRNPACWLLLAGLYLGIADIAWIPFRHTVGEACWLAAMLYLVFFDNQPIEWKKRSYWAPGLPA